MQEMSTNLYLTIQTILTICKQRTPVHDAKVHCSQNILTYVLHLLFVALLFRSIFVEVLAFGCLINNASTNGPITKVLCIFALLSIP